MHFMYNASITLLAGNFAGFPVPPSDWIVAPLVFFLAATGSVLLCKPILLRTVARGLQAGRRPSVS